MQLQLLPRINHIKAIEIAYELQIDLHNRPSSELWVIKALDISRFAVFAVDFSGYGVGAALNTFRLSALMKDVHLISKSPSNYLSILNVMLSELIPLGQFSTMNFAIINVDANTVTYSSAVDKPQIIQNPSSGNVIVCEDNGRSLGIEK
jgi:sigma-B regulation protein RsbU (phosphoserine phosphatase)